MCCLGTRGQGRWLEQVKFMALLPVPRLCIWLPRRVRYGPLGRFIALPTWEQWLGKSTVLFPATSQQVSCSLGRPIRGPSEGGKLLEPGLALAPVLSSPPALCPLRIGVSCLGGNLSGPTGFPVCPEPRFQSLPVPLKMCFCLMWGKQRQKTFPHQEPPSLGCRESRRQ